MSLICRRHCGAIAVVGPSIDLMCKGWHRKVPRSLATLENSPFHITVLNPNELDSLSIDSMTILDIILSSQCINGQETIDVFDIGICHVKKGGKEICYIAIYSKWIDSVRDALGLPSKDLHVTLATHPSDIHDISKGFDTISEWNDDAKRHLQFVEVMISSDTIDYKAQVLMARFARTFLTQETNNTEVLKKIGHWALKAGILKDLQKDLGYTFIAKKILFGLRLLLFSEHIHTLQEYLRSILPMQLSSSDKVNPDKQYELVRLFNIKSIFAEGSNSNSVKALWKNDEILSKRGDVIQFASLPRNFSWIKMVRNSTIEVANYLLAGSAIPSCVDHVAALRSVGITTILTLHECCLSAALVAEAEACGIQTRHFFVVDRTPPSLEQTVEICRCIKEEIDNNRGVLVHCQGGVGRTNFAIIAYLIESGQLSVMDASRIVSESRKVLLADSQREALRDWWTSRTQKLFDSEVEVDSHNNCAEKGPAVESMLRYRDIARGLRMPPLLVLCGFAASGKSTFSTALVKAQPTFFRRINKDEMRAKGQIDSEMHLALREISSGGQYSGCLVVDCCNLTVEKRREWLAGAHCSSSRSGSGSEAWCIFFDFSLEECKERIKYREGHPTIPSGSAGLTILDSMAKQLQPPSSAEAFAKIIRLNTEDDIADLLQQWQIPFEPPEQPINSQKLLKFPRTAHLMNLGAATRDDKILGQSEINFLLSAHTNGRVVYIEEKLDGANMGISIDPSQARIMVQNRSHYVSASYHPQFAPLSRWIEVHSMELWEILEPGRHILYGEWLYATHSVKYTSLPDWFIAYDCYDRLQAKFLSRKALEAMLAGTTISIAPIIHEGPLTSLDYILSLVDAGSAFNKERREGIVIRVCDENFVISRSKLVRKDFIAGNERWDRSARFGLATNDLAPTHMT